ncbi:hypothetical protein, partial [Escherichia coli]|uniref:hypothetical protein n=1 Tax=Escherichia coli TaxID=562 RepID=UPI0013D2501A
IDQAIWHRHLFDDLLSFKKIADARIGTNRPKEIGEGEPRGRENLVSQLPVDLRHISAKRIVRQGRIE